jgi:hypothetical protein
MNSNCFLQHLSTVTLYYSDKFPLHNIKMNGSDDGPHRLTLTCRSTFGMRLVLSVRYGRFPSGVHIPISVVLKHAVRIHNVWAR